MSSATHYMNSHLYDLKRSSDEEYVFNERCLNCVSTLSPACDVSNDLYLAPGIWKKAVVYSSMLLSVI